MADLYQTPIEVGEYMASLLPEGVQKVLEPTPGDGNLVKVLNERGYEVTAPEDFFLLDKGQWFDAVFMNPPFSSKSGISTNAPVDYPTGMNFGYQIFFECLELSDIVIALMPWFTISASDVRLRFLIDYGLKSVTLLPRKTFNYARIQTCVFELRKGYKGTTEFKALDRINHSTNSLIHQH